MRMSCQNTRYIRNKQTVFFLISSPCISGSQHHSSLAVAFIRRVKGHPKRESVTLCTAGRTGNKAEIKEGRTSSRGKPTKEEETRKKEE